MKNISIETSRNSAKQTQQLTKTQEPKLKNAQCVVPRSEIQYDPHIIYSICANISSH